MTHIKSFKVDDINKRKENARLSVAASLGTHRPRLGTISHFLLTGKIGAQRIKAFRLFALVLFISAQDKHTQGNIQKKKNAETNRAQKQKKKQKYK